MNIKLFSEAITEIDDRYYEEAACCQHRRKTRGWKKWAAAACLAAVCAAAFSVLPHFSSWQNLTLPDAPKGDPGPTTAEIHISMGDIFFNSFTDLGDISFNSITGLGDKAIRYDPALYDNVVWDEEAVTRYYGKNLTPAYIPAGLRASPKNQTATVVTDKGGNIKDDTIQLGFYHDYYPDGSEKLTEDVAACKGFSMRVSKIGLRQDCYYMMPENEVKISDIGGINVIFGHRAMPYGPYDAETHAPAGYYDMYIAEFEQAGIAYELISDQLETEELVKIVSSIIYGKEVIVDE